MPETDSSAFAPFLKPAPKAGPGLNRVCSAGDTARRVRAFAVRCGVTRVADITGLDRIGVPVYSAVVPKSDDILSVYNGKGATREDARAGALMEAIERQVALRTRLPLITASFEELIRTERAMNPASLTFGLRKSYHPGRPVDWVAGRDLFDGKTTLVPATAAGYLWRHLPSRGPYLVSSTHGLASGNCLEEAVDHALGEWIERDAWTLAELRSHWLPFARTEAALGRGAAEQGWDDLESYPCLDLGGIGGTVEKMLRRFRAAGLAPIVRDLTSDLGIPTVLAAVAEDDVPGFPQAHFGVGTHPDVSVAAGRALSELAQSRCVDIQAVREDIAQPHGTGAGTSGHTKRIEKIQRRSWLHAPSQARRAWREVGSVWNGDVRSDIRLMLERLRRAGIGEAVAVEFPVEAEGIHVVRVLVPGLESFVLGNSRIGERAARFWREHAA